jgi:hypothetical protein
VACNSRVDEDNNIEEVDSDADNDEEDAVENELEEVVKDVFGLSLLESEQINDDAHPMSKKEHNLSNNGIFTDTVKSDFDVRAEKYGRILAHQSNCEFDQSYFPSGITTNAKKSGHKEKCVVLLCLLILLSKKGADFLNNNLMEK